MNFFREYRKQCLILSAIVLIIVSSITAGRKINANFIDNTLGFIIVPVQNVVTNISNWFGSVTKGVNDKRDLSAENADLTKQVAVLEAENKRLMLYEQENKRLSSLLDVKQKYPEYETVGAQIVAKDPGNWYDTFVIDKGKKDGIKANMVIMDTGGLIGKITEVGYNYAKCQSILDNRSSVSAMSTRTGDFGVVRGDHELMKDGLCIMEYIDSDAQVMEGDEIITNTISDVFPGGISVGTVVEIKSDLNGLTKYAIIKPQVDLKHLDTLLVIKEETFKMIENEEGQ